MGDLMPDVASASETSEALATADSPVRPDAAVHAPAIGTALRPAPDVPPVLLGDTEDKGGTFEPSRLPRRRPTVMTRDVLGERADATDDPRLAAGLQELWDDAVLASRIAAARMRRLNAFWVDGSASDDAMQDRDEADMRVAIALRISPTTASHLVHEAHLARTDLPGTSALLEAGTMPWPWMRRVIRAVRDLETEQRHRLDAMVVGWDLDVTFERFRKDLALAASRVRSSAPLVPEASPAARRRVEVHPDDDEGMACLRVVGPVPDVMALVRRLDASARAVQPAQRRALEIRTEGDQAFPIPYDDSTVEATGRALPLARLRFDLLTRSPLDAGGAEVPAERFRINVVVPAMTLLGVSDTPGTLDGTVPVPAELARSLAGGSDTWYRVLTDPVSGAFSRSRPIVTFRLPPCASTSASARPPAPRPGAPGHPPGPRSATTSRSSTIGTPPRAVGRRSRTCICCAGSTICSRPVDGSTRCAFRRAVRIPALHRRNHGRRTGRLP